jgi:hypothetical protein
MACPHPEMLQSEFEDLNLYNEDFYFDHYTQSVSVRLILYATCVWRFAAS